MLSHKSRFRSRTSGPSFLSLKFEAPVSPAFNCLVSEILLTDLAGFPVPLFWSQSSTLTDMKPAPVLIRPVDQSIATTKLHFDELKRRYGPQVS